MRRLIFALLPGLFAARALSGQRVPGRDLLTFPIGTIAEAPVLATRAGDGLWNPATISLPADAFARASVMTLRTSAEQGVDLYGVSAAANVLGHGTVGFSIVRGSVRDLLRTETDPQPIGGEIPYSTTVYSLTAAHSREHVTAGVAARYRVGHVDRERRAALGVDAGVVADGLLGDRLRLAAATFLWRPGGAGIDAPTYQGGGDLRLVGADSLREARAGYALALTGRESREQYLFTAARYGIWEARAGLGWRSAFGHDRRIYRLGIGLHHARYLVAVARDEADEDVGATYQLLLSAIIK